ncbi:unnamed protein product, partial [Mesorhabditis belari]|uniref:Uncharacterized protein n=1 Tax=Mesorhabditis belari TaxID=2138241 RepID=A0AAF3FP67_9BILA
MRSTQASVIVFLALITLLNAYQLTVHLRSLDLNGFLNDGKTKCSKLSAFGVKCYPLVAICIERIADKTNKADTCLTGPWIELGVWPDNESIEFGKTEKLRGWYNPQDIAIDGNFVGFYVKLRVQHYYGTIVNLIANQIWEIKEFNGGDVDERDVNGTQITSFKFAWTWSGASHSTVSPKTVPTTVSTRSSTTVTKVTKVTPIDTSSTTAQVTQISIATEKDSSSTTVKDSSSTTVKDSSSTTA